SRVSAPSGTPPMLHLFFRAHPKPGQREDSKARRVPRPPSASVSLDCIFRPPPDSQPSQTAPRPIESSQDHSLDERCVHPLANSQTKSSLRHIGPCDRASRLA